ncbi:MAG: hypothetical protein F4Y31_05325 [Gammaproteobacteria bacterium]|nr:hypothetical protein [Gammaproteobacteria bacterium]MYF66220.1 hypothetical protein [Gammaproteobacteria bacterium]MYK38227.1 hypothetical protein [Gammaproteobacteria bacterium]
MRIQIASDLHLDKRPGHMPDPLEEFCPVFDRDLLILAGDVGAGMTARAFIERETMISPVVYVPGNREYHTRVPHEEVDYEWRCLAADLHNLYYLAGEFEVIDDLRIWGGPWYSDLFSRRDYGYLEWINEVVTDFRFALNKEELWSIEQHVRLHEAQSDEIRSYAGFLEVVVTHWPPVIDAMPLRQRGASLAGYYVNDHEILVREVGAQLWVSGNVWGPYDLMVDRTRCIANPAEYPVEMPEADGFEPDRVVTAQPGVIVMDL